jgi:hypothetical protein
MKRLYKRGFHIKTKAEKFTIHILISNAQKIVGRRGTALFPTPVLYSNQNRYIFYKLVITCANSLDKSTGDFWSF